MHVQNIQNEIDHHKTQIAFKRVEFRKAMQKNAKKEIGKIEKQLEELNTHLNSLQLSHDSLLSEEMTKLGFK